MGVSVEYNNFFAYSSKGRKYFNTIFHKGVNIVHGKNTSGKSTFIQALLYTFGINDEKRKLAEILNEGVIFRLDFTIYNPTPKKVSIVRDDEIVSIRVAEKPPVKFIGIYPSYLKLQGCCYVRSPQSHKPVYAHGDSLTCRLPATLSCLGIGGNKSREHVKLKAFLSELFGFTLHLEYDNEYKPASLEAMFLPYYIAQDVGWVYRHKSFRGLDFVKNFKNDFFDYFLGIVNNYTRDH